MQKTKGTMSQKDKRFVIQEHTTGTEVHWDLMLESDCTLQTYRLDKAPEEILHNSSHAVKIFDHSLKFLTYQGPVNKGRGNVCIVETGTYRILQENHDLIKLNLKGQILKGKSILACIKDDNWLLTHEPESSSS